ncbi:MAG: VapC toxin family PIN domain ribonuclease [Pseudonocardia sp.]|nr:VapC toxin family PIN domain ribonuclease [Pseudonocardia sp.]
MKGWLVDKSALWKMPRSPDLDEWIDRINRGLVWACVPTRLEVAVSARNVDHWAVLRRDLMNPLVDATTSPRSERIALEIMDALVAGRLHRSVPLPDVLVASIAVAEGLTVLHDDRDFERIRDVYGGPAAERLVLDRRPG